MKNSDVEGMFGTDLDKEIESNNDEEIEPQTLPLQHYAQVSFIINIILISVTTIWNIFLNQLGTELLNNWISYTHA